MCFRTPKKHPPKNDCSLPVLSGTYILRVLERLSAMSSDPVISPPVTAEIKVRAVYAQGRDEYPLLELEEVEGIDNMAHLVELLWYAIRSCDEVSEDPQE